MVELGASHMEGYVLTNCAYILPYHVLHLFHCDTQNKFLINWLNLIQIHDQMNILKKLFCFFILAREPTAFPGHQPELDPPQLKRQYNSLLTTSRAAFGDPKPTQK